MTLQRINHQVLMRGVPLYLLFRPFRAQHPFIFNYYLPGGSARIRLQCRRCVFDPWVGKVPWRKKWQPTPVFLPGKFHGQKILVRYSPWSHKESDTIEQLSMCTKVKVKSLSQVLLFATPWTVAYQDSPSIGFSRQEYWKRN